MRESPSSDSCVSMRVIGEKMAQKNKTLEHLIEI